VLNPIAGWCERATIVASPNFDRRPSGSVVDLIVIHAISLPPGQFGGDYIERLFQNELIVAEHPYFKSIDGLKVSSHFLIERNGALKQFVATGNRAWHCGESSFEGKARCNDFSIGIELEGCDEKEFTDAQYDSLIEVLVELVRCYPNVTDGRIVGHCDIAPSRKTDPGPNFDWHRTRRELDVKRQSRSTEI
jgi:AmpD protein